jgi:hypothetical protein
MKAMPHSWSVLVLAAAVATGCGTGSVAQAPPDGVRLALQPVTGMRLVYRTVVTSGASSGYLPQRIEEVLRVDIDSLDLRVSEGDRAAIFRLSRSGSLLQVLTPEGRPLSQSADDLAYLTMILRGLRPLISPSFYRAWRVGETQRGVSNSSQGPDTVLRDMSENTYRGTELILGRAAARFETSGEMATVHKGQVFESAKSLTGPQAVGALALGWMARTTYQGLSWIDVRTGFVLRSSGTGKSAGDTRLFEQVLDLEQSRL